MSMKAIVELILVALITIYVVDLSGFTDTWLKFLSAYKGRKITELKPFSCSLCMVWWVCLAFLLMSAKLTLPLVAFSALLSFLSIPMGQILVLLREEMLHIINKLMSRL